MTGSRSTFSIVEIEGRGTILFVGKGGEHRKLTSVYFIPRLKANLVSLSQLDEAGCHISIERGLLKIAMINDGCSCKFGAQRTAFTS